MKKIFSIIIFLVILTLCYFVQKGFNVSEQKVIKIEHSSALTPNTSESIEPSDTFVEKRSTFTYNDQKIQYLLIFPAKYTQSKNQWPMILFLHGSSLRGQNLDLVKKYGPTWVAEQRKDFPFVVLAPQCPEGEDWMNKPDILVALLDDVLKKYRIDQDRVYLTGTSRGGNGTWYLACQHPEYFAAIAPLASNPTIPNSWNKQMITMPIWAFHGEKDPILPLKNDEAMISALRMQGGTPRFTILPDQGHEIAGVYKNHELYDWFLTNNRQR
ncbi:putative peptidase [Sporomusaceae bacterium BoRhaA]|uniref:carboxylesterase family protein n=1 Tax=Pelorhabdus rhamnosifermentans TaxID=2772457 RepID=UPI001C061440|nr:prolyl oligopeptidase family serine peptidase [Pelorhabdus rhamnosifermentans]MBU2700118.1 putative peptidase [Pelorhabdus rhamnosifermentans]